MNAAAFLRLKPYTDPWQLALPIYLFVTVLAFLLFPTAGVWAQTHRAVWAHPRDVGTDSKAIASFLERMQRAHLNQLILMVKGTDGRIFWPSRIAPDRVSPRYREFDLPAALIPECHARHIQVHAWFCNFAEEPSSPIVRDHPEWLMRNPDGNPTTSEILRGSSYSIAWMCPARRPGYADQYLIPLMKEFADRYGVDGIHHDYVRYPGDVAPDQYCYCDDCLERLPAYAGLVPEVSPDADYTYPHDRPYPEAHWEPGPRVLPPTWKELPRAEKSRFLLNGGFFPGCRSDLDYFFYTFRKDAISRFIRETAERIGEGKPDLLFSAAVFKNPVHSGRFIGQDWREWGSGMQILIPMDYRGHYPSEKGVYTAFLKESIERQKQWSKNSGRLWIGISVGQVSKGELFEALRCIAESGVEGVSLFSAASVQRKNLWDDLGKFFAGGEDSSIGN